MVVPPGRPQGVTHFTLSQCVGPYPRETNRSRLTGVKERRRVTYRCSLASGCTLGPMLLLHLHGGPRRPRDAQALAANRTNGPQARDHWHSIPLQRKKKM